MRALPYDALSVCERQTHYCMGRNGLLFLLGRTSKDTSEDGMSTKTLELVPLEQLNEEFNLFVDSIEEQDGHQEPTEEQSKAIGEYVGGPPAKRDRVGLFIRRLEHEALLYKEEAERLAKRGKQMKRLGERMRFGIKLYMEMKGILRAEGQAFAFALRKNPPSCVVVNESDLPGEYMDYKPVPNRQKIKEALQAGEEVPGAILSTGNMRLEIK